MELSNPNDSFKATDSDEVIDGIGDSKTQSQQQGTHVEDFKS